MSQAAHADLFVHSYRLALNTNAGVHLEDAGPLRLLTAAAGGRDTELGTVAGERERKRRERERERERDRGVENRVNSLLGQWVRCLVHCLTVRLIYL